MSFALCLSRSLISVKVFIQDVASGSGRLGTSYRPGLRIWKATVKDRVLPRRQWPRLLRGVWHTTALRSASSQ